MPGWLTHLAAFGIGAALAAGLLLAGGSLLQDGPDAPACSFRPFDSQAVEQAPAATAGPGAEPPSAQARTVLAESVVELRVKFCFEDGSSLETRGSGILITDGPPWRILTANHNVDARQWGAVRDIQIEVLRRGAYSGGAGAARVARSDLAADIAELEVELPRGMVWQPATPPARLTGLAGGSISFLCYFELEIRRGVLLQELRRAGGVPAYELGVPAGPGCSGAGAVNQAGQLVGIVTQASPDVTRISSIAAFE